MEGITINTVMMPAALLAAAALAFGGCAAIRAPAEVSHVPSISSEQLHAERESGRDVVVLDVREANEFIELHIPGAIWFPKSKFDKGDPETLAKLDAIDKGARIVSYCGAGHRSSYVTRTLRDMGYNAYNLDGMSFWAKGDRPVIRGPKRPPDREPATVRLDEAYSHYYLLFDDIVWIDVRGASAYHLGHVKGARSIPLSTIRDNFARIPKDKELLIYCSGTWGGGKCSAALSAGRILIEEGYAAGKIKVLEDGYGAWEHAGYPVKSPSLLRRLLDRLTKPSEEAANLAAFEEMNQMLLDRDAAGSQ